LPGLRKQRKGFDTAKKATRESQYVKKEKKKKKGKEEKKENERKVKKARLPGLQIIIPNFHGSATGLINCLLHAPLGWLVQKFTGILSSILLSHVQCYSIKMFLAKRISKGTMKF